MCACGCGGEVTSTRRGKQRPRFIHGHNGRGVPRVVDARPERIYCACGCGAELRRAKYPSHQRTWVRGHQFRGMRRSVTYDWSRLPADLERLGSSLAVAQEIGVHQSYVWDRANPLGYSVTKFRDGSSRVGRLGEEIALRLLSDAEDMLYRGREPYDLHWRGQRVNVKTAHPSRWGWSFNTARGRESCDLFFLVALDEAERFVAAWVVPAADVTGSIRTGLSERTKFHRYRYA